MRTIAAAPLALLLLAGCGGDGVRSAAAQPGDWRRVATAGDRDRLRNWRTAWVSAVAKARASGSGAAIDAQGLLFDPDRALSGARPPAGAYRCRTFKLGARAAGMPDYIAYPTFACRIEDEGEVQGFYREGGSQRPVGLIFPDRGARAIFLGTLVLGDETRAMDYGRDAGRDMAGYFERVGEQRWRLVLPYPRFESTMDVIEVVPAG